MAEQTELIDTIPKLRDFLDGLGDCTGKPPSLYVDLEGNSLSRNGTLSLITFLVEPRHKVYLIDITTLGRNAFTTAGSDQRTVKLIFESETVTKVFFDIRNDSDALFSLYGISVGGIEDIQLMELASRNFSKKYVKGLGKCIENDATIGLAERRRWQEVKDRGCNLFDPVRGGTYAVFDQRPLSAEIRDYCAQDVVFMPHLRDVYRAKLCDAWWRKIEAETKGRIRLSQSATYDPKGTHKKFGPPGWLTWSPTPAQWNSRTLLRTPHPQGVPGRIASLASVQPARGLSATDDSNLAELVGLINLKGPA